MNEYRLLNHEPNFLINPTFSQQNLNMPVFVAYFGLFSANNAIGTEDNESRCIIYTQDELYLVIRTAVLYSSPSPCGRSATHSYCGAEICSANLANISLSHDHILQYAWFAVASFQANIIDDYVCQIQLCELNTGLRQRSRKRSVGPPTSGCRTSFSASN
jgi:hypothetical protein